MAYIPHTDADRFAMLQAIGVDNIEHLFDAVPDEHRFPKLSLPKPMSEMEVLWELQEIAASNAAANQHPMFLGAGAYNHYVPSAVNHMLLRGEFYTAYTPYQPEMAQGTLQAVYEYQSMISALTGMDAANASHYDGATSLAEAVTVAIQHSRGKRMRVILSPNVHPQYRAVARTYHQGTGVKFIGDKSGRASVDDLVDMLDENTALFVVQYPNFLGQIEDFRALSKKVHDAGALLCMVVDPIALALYKSPGELGADIVVGEGQSLGVPLSFGGPYVGFFAVKEAYVRKIAGRIVGETIDEDGRKAYVMTLRPREQDIRREKASSNICTNQGLMALAASPEARRGTVLSEGALCRQRDRQTPRLQREYEAAVLQGVRRRVPEAPARDQPGSVRELWDHRRLRPRQGLPGSRRSTALCRDRNQFAQRDRPAARSLDRSGEVSEE
jgi:glycine dehydrogenase subunit 1